MAREEETRENLLAEAKALVERAEIELPGCSETVLVGFRSGGSASLFLSPERVYHFNSSGELRRAYVDGLLYKAQRRCLVSLRRVRAEGEVQLWRHDLSDEETEAFLATLATELAELLGELEAGSWRLVGQVPEQADVPKRALSWLKGLVPPIRLAASPSADQQGR